MIQRELVPGKLRIVRRIGAGGMGVVYEAIHLGLDRRVAVKVIHPLSSESAEARARFFREARAMALLRSEHIVQVLDVDTLPEGDPFMVMEYLEGRDLKRELVKRGPLPVAEAVGYLIQASTGVAAAHGAGIIHRDIKPANIFITNLDGARRAKILDFGVAKLSASGDQDLTGPTTQLGTPLYMSPEQIAGSEADSRCDVWALGVVLFQLLTGYSPFRAKGDEGMVSAVLNGTAPRLHEVRDDVPPALSQVVARCLEKIHAERLESALELAAALAPFGPREPLVRPSRRAPRGSSAPPPTILADKDLVELVIAPRASAPLSVPESITVTHPGRKAAHATDSDATVQFRAAKPSPAPVASPPVVSSARHSRSPRSVRWMRLALPIGGLLVLGLVLGLCLPLVLPTTEAPALAPLHASTNAVAPLANAPSRELAPAALLEAAPDRAAPSMSAPEPTLPAPARSRALLENPQRVSVPGTSTESRKRPTPVLPAPPAGSTSVPLHL